MAYGIVELLTKNAACQLFYQRTGKTKHKCHLERNRLGKLQTSYPQICLKKNGGRLVETAVIIIKHRDE